MEETTYKCENCGSDNLEIMMWVCMKTNQPVDDVQPQKVYCRDCGDEVSAEVKRLHTVSPNECVRSLMGTYLK